jgi:hypothetical protein
MDDPAGVRVEIIHLNGDRDFGRSRKRWHEKSAPQWLPVRYGKARKRAGSKMPRPYILGKIITTPLIYKFSVLLMDTKAAYFEMR